MPLTDHSWGEGWGRWEEGETHGTKVEGRETSQRVDNNGVVKDTEGSEKVNVKKIGKK